MTSNDKSIILGAVAEIDLKGEQTPLLLMFDSNNKIFLVIGSHRFEFSELPKGFKASYKNVNGTAFNISEVLSELIPSLADELPRDIPVKLEQVLIAYQKHDSSDASTKPTSNKLEPPKDKSNLIFSTRLGFDINLRELPLLGDKIPQEIDFKLKSFQILYASQDIDQKSIEPFAEDIKINLDRSSADDEVILPSGLNLFAELQIGKDSEFLFLPLSRPKKKTTSQSPQELSEKEKIPTPPSPKTTAKKSTSLSTNFDSEQIELWLELNKVLGPISFQKIGIQYRPKESELWFFLNASLSIGGLTFACNNLGVGSSLSEFKPKFRLDGIAIHYRGSDAVQIGGAFLRKVRPQLDDKGQQKTDNQGNPLFYEEYSGAAIIGTKIKDKKITLTAIGSYTEIDGQASLFIFALLDYPLGGPPAFFVTGLAAGFGYNRSLKVPEKVEDVANFPLVRLAMGEPPPKSGEKGGEIDLLSVMNDLGPYIPPARDEMFFAVGVKFTSFKIVDAFVLLIVKLGKKLEIHILGLATLTAPPAISDDIEPVAEARLALKAVFIPDDGILKIEAVLTEGSYIFSKKCYLSGGFAFYTWFSGEHEGDFVLSLGGYHPEFKIPDHYPRVPRVQLSWQLNDYLSIKGSTYFALTPSALMVGGELEASYRKDNVQACFKIEANFLVAWQPFFYMADISVEIRASAEINLLLTKTTISVNVGASLSIWGPPFAGRAEFKIAGISVSIAFGDGNAPRPKCLDWNEFQKSVLPAKSEVCSISISDGLINKIKQEEKETWIVNAKELVLVAQSAIPSSGVEIADIQENFISDISHRNTEIGIRPMGVRAKEFKATFKITIIRDKKPVNQDFKYQAIYKNVPAAVWKPNNGSISYLPPGQDEEKLVKKALSGFEIRPEKSVEPSKSQEIEVEKLLSEKSFPGSDYNWSSTLISQAENGAKNNSANEMICENTIAKLTEALNNKANHQRRQNLLNSLGFQGQKPETSISESFAEDLFDNPILVSRI
ncbi:DUF6603 domain-containing protein [Nostoc sp. UHCC 0251]|uniref:DUF6603 domain-containing protein n=1 Tax=Nostoc sp. UHCC 0251 TaxID=3110240 RepID=UPI002B21FFC9|nr:DUF6603 domain-containing protein [Nostoc sp. UHCC 0251]MEA5622217.1 DUF6603 domain-containing protein [Nostoc sp. UHCC 0251]